MHIVNSFITLTYNDKHLPIDTGLHYADFQRFIRRLRVKFPNVRYFVCGEYGTKSLRPHFHALLFGVHFADCKIWRERDYVKLYTSKILDSLWGQGFCSVGEVNFLSAGYCARYSLKKVTGDKAEAHYTRVDGETGEVFHVEPEFCHMSLKPGIGYTWFAKYAGTDVIPHDRVVINGKECKPPRYYDKLLAEQDGMMYDKVLFDRYCAFLEVEEDNTPERLEVKEVVKKAQVKQLIRSIGDA